MATIFMNLDLPEVGTTSGPIWATKVNAALDQVDSHDHTTGKGQKIPVAGLNINADLNFNSNKLIGVFSTTFTNLGATLDDTETLYVVSGDIYYNDSNGNKVRITSGGALNISSVGAIGGDYGTGSSAVNYIDSSLSYSFLDSAGAAASLTVGDLSCQDVTCATVTASGATTIQDLTITGTVSGRGFLPVGAVLPLMSQLSGATNVTATTAADANGFVVCAGQTIADATSPLNGQVIPNINNDVFLMGNSTAGTTGGANIIILSEAQLPSHTHTIDHGHSNSFALGNNTVAANTHTHLMRHTHQWGYYKNSTKEYFVRTSSNAGSTFMTDLTGDPVAFEFNTIGGSGTGAAGNLLGSNANLYTTGSNLSNTGNNSSSTTVTLSGGVTSHSGSSGSAGSGSSINNRPNYITAKFIMRIK